MELPKDIDALEAYCLPFVRGEKQPTTAVELMAARYIAYRVGAIDYLVDSHEPRGRNEIDRGAADQWSKNASFDGLEIVNTIKGGTDDDTGEVEFIARYTMNDAPQSHHERSQFKRIDGKWFFCDGKMVVPEPVRRAGPKVGRNDPCPCGSGKKFKKCHGAANAA